MPAAWRVSSLPAVVRLAIARPWHVPRSMPMLWPALAPPGMNPRSSHQPAHHRNFQVADLLAQGVAVEPSIEAALIWLPRVAARVRRIERPFPPRR